MRSRQPLTVILPRSPVQVSCAKYHLSDKGQPWHHKRYRQKWQEPSLLLLSTQEHCGRFTEKIEIITRTINSLGASWIDMVSYILCWYSPHVLGSTPLSTSISMARGLNNMRRWNQQLPNELTTSDNIPICLAPNCAVATWSGALRGTNQ